MPKWYTIALLTFLFFEYVCTNACGDNNSFFTRQGLIFNQVFQLDCSLRVPNICLNDENVPFNIRIIKFFFIIFDRQFIKTIHKL